MTRKTIWTRGSLVSFAGAASLLTACATEVEVPLAPDTSTPAPETSKFVRADKPIPGRYIVVLDAPKDSAERARIDVAAEVSALASTYSATVAQTWSSAVHGFTAEMTEDQAKKLADDPKVVMVEEDGVVTINATQNNAIPGLDRIDQQNLPLNGTYNFNADGSGITAFIVDTGIRATHREFGGRVNTALGFTAINDGRGSDDCNGHGTHVAGTVGSATFGVAKNVALVPVRVLGCDGSGSNSGVIAGIDHVAKVATRGKAVANMSLGGGASAATDAAINRAVAAGVVMAVAAGNENTNACNGSPARAPNAITVAASDFRDRRASFSNFGTCVDIFAPGVGILSTSNGSDTATATLSGTSMATPHVAGGVALFLAANPGATPAQVATALIDNAGNNKITDVQGSPNKLLFTGFIGAGQPNPDPDPQDPPPATGTPRTGSATGSVARNRFARFSPLPVLEGTKIVVTLSGSGDPDLYVRFGAAPTLTAFACESDGNGATERCELTVPAGQDEAFIAVFGFSNANFRVDASWTEP